MLSTGRLCYVQWSLYSLSYSSWSAFVSSLDASSTITAEDAGEPAIPHITPLPPTPPPLLKASTPPSSMPSQLSPTPLKLTTLRWSAPSAYPSSKTTTKAESCPNVNTFFTSSALIRGSSLSPIARCAEPRSWPIFRC